MFIQSSPAARLIIVGTALMLFNLYGCGEPTGVPPPVAVDSQQARTDADRPASVAAGNVGQARIVAADSEPGNWLAHGRTYDEQRFSPLNAIDKTNIGRLGLAWEFATDSTRGLEATPIVVDGIMFVTSTWSRVFALDAKTGALLWRFDPQVERAWGRRLCCDIVNRGVAVWGGKVYVGTLDGYLVALDAASGAVRWKVDTLTDRDKYYSITGAPRVVKGKVIIGNGGAEYAVRGYVTAYDAETGALGWRFFTVPGSANGPFEHPALAAAAPTWDPQSAWGGLGGTVWDSMAYDPALDLLYIGTGNGGPWPRSVRSPAGGDNLYLASILALRPDTGELVWYYQTTPGDNWDYTATQHMILADLEMHGRERRVLLQAPKNGFFYVLDRATGELISARKYAFVNWASRVDPATGRPLETGYGDYSSADKYVFPSPAGAHNWQPMSYSRHTGLVYIPARDIGWVFNLAGDHVFTYGADNVEALSEGQQIPPVSGYLKAWNPVSQQLVWQLGTPNIWNGGVLSTAGGLVFYGTASGRFLAVDDQTGTVLKDIHTGTGIIAPPISYSIDGQQYIAVLAGYGGPAAATLNGDEALLSYANNGRVLVFRLDGDTVPLPPAVAPRGPFPTPPDIQASAETVAKGRTMYIRHCAACHGIHGSIPMLPDLRRMTSDTHRRFAAIVLGGVLEPDGMASFSDTLTPVDVTAIQAYIVDLTRRSIAAANGPAD